MARLATIIKKDSPIRQNNEFPEILDKPCNIDPGNGKTAGLVRKI